MLLKRNHAIFFCIVILSAVSFFWLIAHIFSSLPWHGDFIQRDPDSMLFARLLEQSLLRGKIVDADSYGCFPYEIRHGFAPFYLYFLVNTTNLFFTLFPSCAVDPILVVGVLPIIFAWLSGLMIVLTVWRLAKDSRLVYFCAFFMLPGAGASLTAELIKLDYDFLISFFIWSWLCLAALFLAGGRQSLKICAGLVTGFFLASWLGTPLFFFFATLYGLALWLSNYEEARSYNEFAFSSMLVGGILNILLIFLKFPESASLSLSKYSFFQPMCVIAGGFFLYLLNYLKRFRRPRLTAIILLLAMAAMISLAFHEQLMQSTGLLFKKDPVHETISELASMVKLSTMSGLANIVRDLTNYLGWPVVFLSFLLILRIPGFEPRAGRLLKSWIILMTLLSIYQVRFLRWPGIGMGLMAGIIIFHLWQFAVRALENSRLRNVKLIGIFLPLCLAYSLQCFAYIENLGGIEKHQVESFNWIAGHTPPTSGYVDEKRPEYSILSYWDEGNLLAYYTKRPVAVNNAMWGFKTMADIFSSQNEDDAWNLCGQYGVKYIYLTTYRRYADKSYGLWPFFKAMPKKPEYVLQYKEVPISKDFKNWFYFWLLDNLALTPKGHFNAGSRFRVVYAAKADDDTLAPVILFERVAGAKLHVIADPGSEVSISLELKISSQGLAYKVKKIADQEGNVSFVLPYTTSHHSGRVSTDVSYRLGYNHAGRHIRAAVFVAEQDVAEGLNVKTVEIQ